MTRETNTPITQEQIDFIISNMKEKGLNVNGYPTTVEEGMTVHDWLFAGFSEYVRLGQKEDGPIPRRDERERNLYLTKLDPYLMSSFSEMDEAQKMEFIKEQMFLYEGKPVDVLESAIKNSNSLEELKTNISSSYVDFTKQNNTYIHYLNNTVEHLKREYLEYLTELEGFISQYPSRVKPEPMVEKPVLGMSTTSKDHRVRIDQWMEHLGKKDQAQTLVDKYGLDVAYAICQQSMLSPKNIKDVTGNASLSSKNAVQYFLDNDVSAEKLAKIPTLNEDIVKASLDSVKPAKPVEKPIVKEEPIITKTIDLEKMSGVSIDRDALKAEIASITASTTIDPTAYLSNKKMQRRLDAAEKAAKKENKREDKIAKIAKRKNITHEEAEAVLEAREERIEEIKKLFSENSTHR